MSSFCLHKIAHIDFTKYSALSGLDEIINTFTRAFSGPNIQTSPERTEYKSLFNKKDNVTPNRDIPYKVLAISGAIFILPLICHNGIIPKN